MKINDSQFWNKVYSDMGFCWGGEPSEFVRQARPFLSSYKSILELGCGYCRDLVYLSCLFPEKKITGIDISNIALQLFEQYAKEHQYELSPNALLTMYGDITSISPSIEEALRKAQCLLCHSLLHLFQFDDRKKILESLNQTTEKSTSLIMSVYSTEDKKCGIGEKTAPNTFKCSKSFPLVEIHFFSEKELIQEFEQSGWSVIQLIPYEEKEIIYKKLINSQYLLIEGRKA